ncbi:hypothetical protein HK098_004860 [Nowakowskiella sp. JEL0407]|nr:hypothetical protein HK098_004860 [Nowakowskiella sp. JEL0407]
MYPGPYFSSKKSQTTIKQRLMLLAKACSRKPRRNKVYPEEEGEIAKDLLNLLLTIVQHLELQGELQEETVHEIRKFGESIANDKKTHPALFHFYMELVECIHTVTDRMKSAVQAMKRSIEELYELQIKSPFEKFPLRLPANVKSKSQEFFARIKSKELEPIKSHQNSAKSIEIGSSSHRKSEARSMKEKTLGLPDKSRAVPSVTLQSLSKTAKYDNELAEIDYIDPGDQVDNPKFSVP